MTIELLESSISSLEKWENMKSLHEQFVPPYKYYNRKFNFYSANWLYVDEKWKWVKNKKDENTKTAKLDLETRLRSEVTWLIWFWEQTIFPVWIQAIKDYQMCTLDRALMLKATGKEWLTNEKQPIVRTYVDRIVTSMFRWWFSFNIYPQNETKVKKAKKAKSFAERCFSTANMRRTLLDASTDGVLLGNGYYRIWFSPSREKMKQDNNPELKDAVHDISEVYATTEYVSPFNIFYEPWRNFYKQPIIYRNWFSLREILKDKKDFFKLDKDQIALILWSPKPFSDKNFNKVKLIKYYQQYLLNNDLTSEEKDLYKVRVNDDLVEYVEREDGKNLIISINGYIVYDYINPTPTGRHRYKWIWYTRTPGVSIGDGAGTILAWSQKLYDALFNIMFDLAKFAAGPMFLLKPGQAIEWMWTTLKYDPFSFKQLRGAADATIDTLQLPRPDNINFQMMNDILNMANFAIAPTTYNELSGVSRSATDAQYRNESLKDAILPLSESINESFAESLKDFFMLAKQNMPDKFKISVLGKDQKQLFETITLADLKGNFTFEVEFDSVKDINKTVERAQLTNLINVLPQISTDPVSQRFLINMEAFTTYALSLFVQNSDDIMLKSEEFYAMSEEWQKQMLNLQKNLQEFQTSLQWSPLPPEFAPWSQYNQQPSPGEVPSEASAESPWQVWSAIEMNGGTGIDVASILKESNQ